ncbi:hypothetical protein [Streptomyces sp. NPDC050145]|uniref:hypothetical protein n=1 Tax=Streptomyces sp. NPDC050145 TaxID=3365602 RepID=UPI00379C7CDA
MKHIRSVAWAGIAVAALATTTACSAETAKKTADAVGNADTIMAALTRASDRTKDLGSAEIESTTDLGTGAGPVSMDGTYSWGDGAAYDVMMDTKAAQMQSVQDDPTLRAKMVDGAYFYNVDPQPSGPLAGKHWMRVDVSAVLGESGAAAADKNADPTAGLRYIGLSKSVKDLGEETIRGKKATHYRGSITPESVNKSGSGLSQTDKDGLMGSFTGDVDKVTYDIWVDGDDLPVRMNQSMGRVSISMDFVKFGSTKPVTAPPVSDTADLTEQVKQQGAGGTAPQG